MYDEDTPSQERDALDDITADECEGLLRCVAEWRRSDPSLRRWETACTYLVGRVRWLESLAAAGDPLAAEVRADLVALMDAPVGETFDRLFGAATDPLTVAAVREGLRQELPKIRATLRAELSRSRAPVPVDTLTTDEAAALCRNTPKTILRWVRLGRLRPLGGPPYVFRRADVETARDRRPNGGNVVDLDRRADEILGRRGR